MALLKQGFESIVANNKKGAQNVLGDMRFLYQYLMLKTWHGGHELVWQCKVDHIM
jgi:hypothetical protein